MGSDERFVVLVGVVLVLSLMPFSMSDDAAVMKALRGSITSPGLNWTSADVCSWSNVRCDNGPGRVTAIQIPNLNLAGTLPKDLGQLGQLQHFDCRANNFTGAFPHLATTLQTLNINNNGFTSFPEDFFEGMSSLQVVSIGANSFSQWKVPESLKDCVSLTSFSAIGANFSGKIPEFFGSTGPFGSLQNLSLSFNNFDGGLPDSFSGSGIQHLWVNVLPGNNKLSGTLSVLQNMTSLRQIWVHGNNFTGPIPDFSNHDSLYDVSLRDNKLTGVVPESLVNLPSLKVVNLTNNRLQGPPPKFRDGVRVDDVINQGNQFCTNVIGGKCSEIVDILLKVVEPLGYPLMLAESWSGNDPCGGNGWMGIDCDGGIVRGINFQNKGFSGTISPSFAKLTNVTRLLLNNNRLTGTIPEELTTMPNLMVLDVSNNQLYGKVPKFREGVKVNTSGNPDIGKDKPSGGGGSSSGGVSGHTGVIVGVVVGILVLLVAGILLYKYCGKNKGGGKAQPPNAIVVHPRRSGEGDALKISVADATAAAAAASASASSPKSDVHHVEASNFVISIQVLRQVTNNFSQENILGKGGFGTVYKGELPDGTQIAVKRMESGVVGEGEKGLTEFNSEIAVLTKVRHRHLVELIGHCLDGHEGLLVYEYMPQGPLSRHLFDWKDEGIKPLEWKQRLIIALDVARGVEYLHNLAQQIFIHRDLKPSNILLGHDLRAKVSDFGLVRLAPEGQTSFETRLAGTFGYLAPEYAVTGRVTTKVDVYSFGVVLMEMITGRKAIDNSQQEENIHLVTWFRRMLLNKDSFRKAIDPAIDTVDEETLASVITVSDLAGHCCAREPYQRPDMGHVVNVLAPLVEVWKPTEPRGEDTFAINFDESLPEALSKWQAYEGTSTMDISSSSSSTSMLTSRDNTQSSIPNRPVGFAETFTSYDGR
ncbi:hypothetical protein HN51_033393 [Arachis hypogaea]|uniref:receptor protein kinase TMK1 n=1 Tax=Arachis hypogaea TaxID=3818 RepID=UPI000DECF7A8|nr:receptor protein kinase TMK1 [Arachis hypogaea]QHO17890.1 Receptor protein kinase [Arachis hypogaea]